MNVTCDTLRGRFRSLLLLILALQLSACATSIGSSERQAIAGKTYVTIGASSGFGRGVAEALSAQHANVVLAAKGAPTNPTAKQ